MPRVLILSADGNEMFGIKFWSRYWGDGLLLNTVYFVAFIDFSEMGRHFWAILFHSSVVS